MLFLGAPPIDPGKHIIKYIHVYTCKISVAIKSTALIMNSQPVIKYWLKCDHLSH